MAVHHGHLQVMEAINNIDAHMDHMDEYNKTHLMWASNNDQAASVKWLPHHDADVNCKDVYYFTTNQKITEYDLERSKWNKRYLHSYACCTIL